jgi:short-subunit dehydrogenase
MEEQRKTALITGATSGIGLELTKLFAANGYNLVLVARNVAKLNETAVRLINPHVTEVMVIPCDLSHAGAAQQVYDEVKQKGITVNVLVNDAGAGEHGPFNETSLDEELAIIQLNVASLVHMTKLFLREMLQRNEGRILQLASIASYQPTPFLAVYAATKAFVLSFTDAVTEEIRESNVTMTALIPGATDTDFFYRAHAENTRAAQHTEDPAVVAKVGYEALMRGDRHAVAPGIKKQILMSSILPNKTIVAMARRQMEEMKDGDPLSKKTGKQEKQEEE